MDVTENVLNAIVDDLIDSCILDDALYLHRAIKLRYSHLVLVDAEESDVTQSEAASKNDSVNKFPACCRCIKCHCKVAATRYASHLSNCMGLGRNSSRRANKRIAEQQRFEDSDGVDDAYYLDSSPASTSALKTEHSSQAYAKTHSSGYISRTTSAPLNPASSKSAAKLGASSSRTSYVRNLNTLHTEPAFEKFDSFDGVAYFCDEEESNLSEPSRRPGGSHNKRHCKGNA